MTLDTFTIFQLNQLSMDKASNLWVLLELNGVTCCVYAHKGFQVHF